MRIKIDMHVHAALPKSEAKAKKKVQAFWEEIKKAGISVIISAEHCYKNPERAFNVFASNCPKGCVVLPGSEILSKEGIDIVVFHKDSSIFKEKKLLEPFGMEVNRIIDYLNKKGYAYFIPHLFTLGGTSIFKIGKQKALKMMKKAKSVEVHNTSFSGAKFCLKQTGVCRVFNDLYKRMENVENLPQPYWKSVKFVSGGSDAHTPQSIGSYLSIQTKYLDAANVHKAIISNNKDDFFVKTRFSLSAELKAGYHAFSDWFTKHLLL